MTRFINATAFAVLTALTFALPGHALSCFPSSPEKSFAHYHAAPEMYQVWSGRWIKINPTPDHGGYVDPVNGVEPYPVMYRFKGRQVGAYGRKGPVRLFPVLVDPQCAGPWCPNYPGAGEQIVGFFERTNSGLRKFSPGACSGAAFKRTAENVHRISSCFTSGMCH